jgi:hypothetical protein
MGNGRLVSSSGNDSQVIKYKNLLKKLDFLNIDTSRKIRKLSVNFFPDLPSLLDLPVNCEIIQEEIPTIISWESECLRCWKGHLF